MFTVIFYLQKQVLPGQAVYIMTDSLDWNIDCAIKMKCLRPSLWTIQTSLLSESLEYKYVVADYESPSSAELHWEEGPNRKLLLFQGNPTTIKDRWERRKMSLYLQVPFECSLLLLFGNCEDLNSPRRMKKRFYDRQPCYYCHIYLTIAELDKEIQVQYYILQNGTQEYIGELIRLKHQNQRARVATKVEFTKL